MNGCFKQWQSLRNFIIVSFRCQRISIFSLWRFFSSYLICFRYSLIFNLDKQISRLNFFSENPFNSFNFQRFNLYFLFFCLGDPFFNPNYLLFTYSSLHLQDFFAFRLDSIPKQMLLYKFTNIFYTKSNLFVA